MPEGRTRNERGGPSTPLLSKSKILAAGLELVDENGLAEFSVQTVADKLGVFGASIYRNFSDREQPAGAAIRGYLHPVRGPSRLLDCLSNPLRRWEPAWRRGAAQ